MQRTFVLESICKNCINHWVKAMCETIWNIGPDSNTKEVKVTSMLCDMYMTCYSHSFQYLLETGGLENSIFVFYNKSSI